MRPLTGSREVMRRLEERNTSRKERLNRIRKMGGLEPVPERNSSLYTFSYGRRGPIPSSYSEPKYEYLMGLPNGYMKEMFGNLTASTRTKMSSYTMDYFIGKIPREEYIRLSKLEKIKEKKDLSNKEAQFILDREY